MTTRIKTIQRYHQAIFKTYQLCCHLLLVRRDSTDGRAVVLYPEDPGSSPDVSMLQRVLWLSVSADRPN